MEIDAPNIDAANAELALIPVDQIDRNPHNPRIIFRQDEMDDLLDSIRQWGVQVPISVYRKKRRFILIDGERRWRCCLKLNRKTIPALIQDEPSKLMNILLMFNIHALREQWDLLTIALKLRDVIELLQAQSGRQPTERDIADATGLKQGVVRRCRYLLNLPEHYHAMILRELEKPKSQQVFTEDFFIEMERALRTVERAMPEVMPDKNDVRDILIEKFRDNVIDNRVHFRQVGKIARAENVESDPRRAQRVLKKLFDSNDYSIKQAYEESVSDAYAERDILTRIDGLIERLKEFDPSQIDDDVRQKLRDLVRIANRMLKE